MIDELNLNSVPDYLRAIRDVSLLKEQIDIAVKELLQDLLKEHFYKHLYELLDDLFSGYEIINEDYEGYPKYHCGFHCKIAVPCLVFGIIGGLDTAIICFMAFVYGLLEEYGWRGFLQNELKGLPVWQYVLIITVMWFLWHLDLDSRNILPFFLILLFASWGIGKIATDTHSLLFCAAFHGIVNFSKRGRLADTTFLVAFICVIVFWIAIWYFVDKPAKDKSAGVGTDK